MTIDDLIKIWLALKLVMTKKKAQKLFLKLLRNIKYKNL